ncbi:hypothetical protein OAF98_04680 [Planctomicrobium sp.]|jgi:hypothetical protein|nr:hypothetical protein [Planctomicrobium sp.]MBT5017677.1 hypothetical protein [Planctomicrobium sp.]MDB4743762.1 hypothetical protein [Planctomicrobium sp.]
MKIALVCLLLVPTICFAAATSEEGNKPLSAANYTDWPNLVDAINDESRVFQFWVNGNESFHYQGDTATANRVLREFAETNYPGLQVVLLPGPATTMDVLGKKVTTDYRINIMGGIARAAIGRGNLKRVYFLQPTMTIYLTDNIELSSLKIPQNVELLQLHDLETRFQKGLEDDDQEVQKTAQRLLDQLNKEFQRQGNDYKKLEEQLAQIESFVKKQNSSIASEK